MPGTREISPFLVKIRNFLGGRAQKQYLRFQPGLAPRPGPQANLPEGPAHKVSGNYYYTRDARREVEVPTNLAENTAAGIKALGAGGAEAGTAEVAKVAKAGARRPGAVFNYSQ